jgi:hypothetical protein
VQQQCIALKYIPYHPVNAGREQPILPGYYWLGSTKNISLYTDNNRQNFYLDSVIKRNCNGTEDAQAEQQQQEQEPHPGSKINLNVSYLSNIWPRKASRWVAKQSAKGRRAV